jgi:SAM-dependent methyltransferase
MDRSLVRLRVAEQFRRAQGLRRVRFVQADLLHPPFAPASFDAALCGSVLRHVRDPVAGLRSVAALVKPGGHVVLRLHRRYAAWGETLEWFERCGLGPVRALTEDEAGPGSLFDPPGTRLERWAAEAAFTASGGGSFAMIGRKP